MMQIITMTLISDIELTLFEYSFICWSVKYWTLFSEIFLKYNFFSEWYFLFNFIPSVHRLFNCPYNEFFHRSRNQCKWLRDCCFWNGHQGWKSYLLILSNSPFIQQLSNLTPIAVTQCYSTLSDEYGTSHLLANSDTSYVDYAFHNPGNL